jgi:redox-sensitive bicupin YhaK (pirin superfamily)
MPQQAVETRAIRPMKSLATSPLRSVVRIVRGQAVSDGAGVKLNRMIGQRDFEMLDPFLLLDEFRSDRPGDYAGGFPQHPHRGFEAVTYLLAGRLRHGDDQGHSGVLDAGGVQWMTAGRGVVHSEMPEQASGLLWGFQLWVNLPAGEKMRAPRYQEIDAQRIPAVAAARGATVRVIAGALGGRRGPIEGIATAPAFFDVSLLPGARLDLPLPSRHCAFVHVFEGAAAIGAGDEPEILLHGELGVLDEGVSVSLLAGDAGARMLVVAGRPLHEPVTRYGPFVMNTPEQIVEAIRDLSSGRFSR